MIKALRFIPREFDNRDGTAYTIMVLQQLVPLVEADEDGFPTVVGEEWKDVPTEDLS